MSASTCVVRTTAAPSQPLLCAKKLKKTTLLPQSRNCAAMLTKSLFSKQTFYPGKSLIIPSPSSSKVQEQHTCRQVESMFQSGKHMMTDLPIANSSPLLNPYSN
jgi:hypothetical protein